MKSFYTLSKAAFFIFFMAFSGPLSIKSQTVTQTWAALASMAKPSGIAIDASGNVYTANGNNTVSKITAAGGVTVAWATLASDAYPNAIAIDVSGNVYTANAGNHTVSKITAAGTVVTQAWATLVDGASPTAIAIDLSGNVYIANQGNSTVNKISTAGTVTQTWTLTVGAIPLGIASDASGNVYTANSGNNTVSQIAAAGILTDAWATLADRIMLSAAPWSITVDASGNVYTANSGDDTVSKITAAGTVTRVWAQLTDGASPIATRLNMSSSIYTANTNSTVSKITAAGVLTEPWATLCSCAVPSAIAIDASGNVYTANYGNSTVSKIVPAVALSVEFLDFEGQNTEGGNFLTWETANEGTNKGFNVEWRTSNGQWETLGFVKPKGKAATYNFTHTTPSSTAYYRLRQIDNDGTETFSKIISIVQKGRGKGLTIYPNPVSNTLTVENTDLSRENREGGYFQVTNLLGQQILTGKTPSLGVGGIDVSALPQGTYLLRVGAEQAKFVKQ